MTPALDTLDHIHVFVADRAASERWYAQVLGLTRVPELESWAADGGPLTIGNATGSIHLALFERAPQPCRSTIAFGVSAAAFDDWCRHLAQTLGRSIEPVDHASSWSVYFTDPDGNPYEITSYEYAAVAQRLRAAQV
jgi:catechol-2,3-dioxygenase